MYGMLGTRMAGIEVLGILIVLGHCEAQCFGTAGALRVRCEVISADEEDLIISEAVDKTDED